MPQCPQLVAVRCLRGLCAMTYTGLVEGQPIQGSLSDKDIPASFVAAKLNAGWSTVAVYDATGSIVAEGGKK